MRSDSLSIAHASIHQTGGNDDGALTVALGPDGGDSFTLTERYGDTFSFVPTAENAPQGSLSSAVFTVESDKATSLKNRRCRRFGIREDSFWREIDRPLA